MPFAPLENPEWLSSWKGTAQEDAKRLSSVEHYGIGIDAVVPDTEPSAFVAPEYRVEASKGLELSTWKEALAQEETAVFLERLFSSTLIPSARTHLGALGRSQFASALVVYVQPTLDDAGIAIEETLLLETTLPPAQSADLVIIIAKTGSRFRLTERTIGGSDASVFARTTIVVTEEDAKVYGETSATASGFVHHEVVGIVGPYAAVKWREEPNVSGNYRSLTMLRLVGPSAEGEVLSLLIADGTRKADVLAEVEHCADETRARVLAAGVATDSARIVYRGNIRMKEGVHATDGDQEGRFLVLAPTARVDAIPALDIASKDVRSTHKLSVSHVKSDDLFYAQARGIPESGARTLALEGFFGTLVAKSAGAELSEEFRERIARLDPPPQ